MQLAATDRRRTFSVRTLAAANGKIYVMGGFVPPKDAAIPVGGAWEPIDNACEYDPAADSWKSLPALPGKRGSAIAAEVGGKIYVIGGATTTEGSKDPFFSFFGSSRVRESALWRFIMRQSKRMKRILREQWGRFLPSTLKRGR